MMAKLGINLTIDVTKIDKNRLFIGKNGAKYLNLTTFIDTEKKGQYGDHGFITEATTKKEREDKIKLPILGNAKIFFSTLPKKEEAETPQSPPSSYKNAGDDVPF